MHISLSWISLEDYQAIPGWIHLEFGDVFAEVRKKGEVPGEKPSEQRREPTNSAHIWHQLGSNPGLIGGKRFLSPLCHPAPQNWRHCPICKFCTITFLPPSWILRLWDIQKYVKNKNMSKTNDNLNLTFRWSSDRLRGSNRSLGRGAIGAWGGELSEVVHSYLYLPDITLYSCGGNLLMNVGPTPDGRIVPAFEERLLQMGQWLSVNGKAIYSSKPWKARNDTVNKDVWLVCRSVFNNVDQVLMVS